MFTHLHVHTQFSILDGAAPIKKLIERAAELGQNSIAITDHGNMFGVKEFHKVATKAGIKPILGCEVYVADNRHQKDGVEYRSGEHLIVLAKNLKGYYNLIKLVSYGWTEGFYYTPRIDKELLEKYHEGLICSSACLGGEIPQFLMRNDLDGAREAISWYKELFGEDYYLEMQLHRSGDPRIDSNVYENQKSVNQEIIKLAEELGVKYIATNDVHYVEADDAESHDRLICLSTGRDLDDPDRMRYTTQEYLKSTEQMKELFKDYPLAISNTQEIADKIEEYSLERKPYMPHFPLPDEFEVEFTRFKESLLVFLSEGLKKVENKEESTAYESLIAATEVATRIEQMPQCEEYGVAREQLYLEQITQEGAKRRYGKKLDKKIQERLDYELKTIEWMGYPGYFLIVWDFIREGRERGVAVGPGRGSAAGSVVAYSLGITNIDPLKYNLLFERFLNPERISMPDIDIDFDEDGREEVLRYVVDKYGKKRVAHIITFGTMAARSSIKDVARIHKLALSESDRLSKMVPEEPGITLEKAYREVPELAAERESENELISSTLKYAERLEGSVRQTGVHACGVIIGQDDLENFIPISTAKDSELNVVQYEGSQVEEVGLLKMDFLGLKTLSIIKDAVENVKLSKGIEIDIDTIPLNDKKTFELYSAGDTTGLFQFESPGMKKHLRSLKPNRFEDLIAMNALYRPGPMKYIDSFVRRKHGHEEIMYDLPVMEEYLSDTYGITVYQEQVMLLSQKLANFTGGQADQLRRAMGKKVISELSALKNTFMEGSAANGHPADVCEKIWCDWEDFAQYAFNKSHSTCYALVSYQTAYLKAHYPAEFMAALLSRNLSDIKRISLFMDECKRMDAPVKGPDVNRSHLKFSVDEERSIRFGMGGIKGVGENATLAIIKERTENGRFKNIYNFIERVPTQIVNKKNMECLAMAGAFDSLAEFDRSSFFAEDRGAIFIEHLIRYGTQMQSERNSSQFSLFGNIDSGAMIQKPTPSEANIWSKSEMLEKERELVGIYLSSHPLDDYRIIIETCTNSNLGQLDDLSLMMGRKLKFIGMITQAKHLTSRNGKPFGVITVEDFTGSHEFRLFSPGWEQFRPKCIEQSVVMISGQVREHPYRPGELEFKFENVEYLDEVVSKLRNLEIALPIEAVQEDFIGDIHGLSLSNSGEMMLSFKVFDPESGIWIKLNSRSAGVGLNLETLSFLEESGLDFKIS